mgnify:CR=1 FL=1
MNKNEKIFVAGHGGMVGSAITNRLRSEGYNNLILKKSSELDLRDQKATLNFFEKEKPDHVFLAAAKVGGIYANDKYKADFIYDNTAIAMNVIHSAFKSGVKKLLNLGSSCIYPKYAPQPMKEEYLLTGELEPTNEPYAISKITAIKLCRYFNEQYGTNFISLMPSNLYGKNDNFNLETSHVLPALIRKIILAKSLTENDFDLIKADLHKTPLGFGAEKKYDLKKQEGIINALKEIGIQHGKVALWGTGKVKREFLFSDDIADASLHFMQNIDAKEAGEFINVGSGNDLSIKELAFLITEIAGFQGKIVFTGNHSDGTPRKLLDISKAKELRWQPKTDLKTGIKEVVENYYDKLK